MILTVTLNPSVDIQYRVDAFRENHVHRAQTVSKTAGGKGLNVTRVLYQLNEEVIACGFAGGPLGSFIEAELDNRGIAHEFTPIAGETRNCIAIIHDGKQTEILEAGPVITEKEIESFLTAFQERAEKVEVITISGSLPKGVPENFYNQLLEIANKANKPVLLDTKSTLIQTALEKENIPFLIKPNQEEFEELAGITFSSIETIIGSLKKPLFSELSWVVVTLGKDGAIVKHGDKIYRVVSPAVEAVNPVGSGDSVIAGLAAGYRRGLEGKDFIQFGIVMGVLNALEEQTGKIRLNQLDDYLNQIEIREIT
ncbi:hexose kinase [Oceanobacillus jeddahense]|uniref:hexose kinase n=1 Tax=Oceanobacillus jeddahense TaxID=1462527 RepID=UPI00059634D6|nr:hexose kinase [Oceanobacillus jeddahense]